MISPNEFAAVAELDLEAIKVKLMNKKGGSGWSAERTDAVEIEYRRFLYLMKMFPNVPAAPTVDVDTFWHQHILDTMKYAADCDRIFGYFLHHFPYVGMRGKEDEKALVRLAGRMGELYEATFGESYPGTVAEGIRPRTALSAGVHIRKLAVAQAQPAFCAQIGPEAAAQAAMANEPAYCAIVTEPLAEAAMNTEPAYCAIVSEPLAEAAMNTEPAYCAIVTEPLAEAAMNTEPAYRVKVKRLLAGAAMNTDPAFCAKVGGAHAAMAASDCEVALAEPSSDDVMPAYVSQRSIAPEFSPSFYTQRPRLATA